MIPKTTYLLLLALLLPAPASAQVALNADNARKEPTATPPTAPPFHIDAVRASDPVQVDAVLDEPVWKEATAATDFIELMPQTGRPAQRTTEAYTAYGPSHLYIAFRAYDDPTAIRATRGKRDDVYSDDFVIVSIDTRGTAQWAYALGANPHGVQLDMRDMGNNQDPKLDIVFESAGRITDDGYVVELAIPFSSLGGVPGEEPWRINFMRQHPRDVRRIYSWTHVTRDESCVLCQHGSLSGFDGVTASSDWSVMPTLVSTQASSRTEAGDLAHGTPTVEPSLSASFRTAGGLRVDGTYNPDFSQVESDVAQIDVNSSLALFYPERRPFFQEGSELYDMPLTAVYTRSINAPIAAGRIAGEQGAWRYAYLGAQDETSPMMVPLRERTLLATAGASTSHVLRASRSVGNGSHFGAVLTDRSYESGTRGTALGVDGVQHLGSGVRTQYQLLVSRTAEGDSDVIDDDTHTFSFAGDTYTAHQDAETFGGLGGHLSVQRQSRHTSVAVKYRFASPTLQAANGFLQKNDYHDVEINGGLTFQPGHGLVKDFSPRLEVGREWTWDGAGQRTYVEPMLQFMGPAQTALVVNHYHAHETFAGYAFPGIDRTTVMLQAQPWQSFGMFALVKVGDEIARMLAAPEVGHGMSAVVQATLKPTASFTLEPRVVYGRLDRKNGAELYAGSIARLDGSYQFTSELNFRLTAQYNEFSDRFEIDPLISYQLTPFSVFYAGATHNLDPSGDTSSWGLAERQFFVKLQYQFGS